MTANRPSVSLIATVLNERANFDAWMAAIDAQTLTADEIVIVDGGSTDGTFEALRQWKPRTRLTVEQAPGVNISEGRNIAIARSICELIAVTDAGTRARPDWLERLTAAFADPCVDVAAGFFVPIVESTWEAALAATTLPDAGEIDPTTFLPSSRSVAVRRTWLDAGIVYPEWLDYCEDVVLDLMLRRAGARAVFVRDAIVEFRTRNGWRPYWRQYFRYARGDGKAGLFPKRHAVRYVTYLALLVALRRSRAGELALAVTLGMAYIARPYRRLWSRSASAESTRRSALAAALLVPALRMWGDLAKMAGYPAGIAWRVRRFGGIGPRINWRRIDPSGRRWRL